MNAEYSGRSADDRGALLVVDTGSPRISIAVGGGGAPVALRVVDQQRSSRQLLGLVAATMDDAGLGLGDLRGLVGLRGPGSFTGLRVGLAVLLGLHHATGIPAGALDTLDVLAWGGPVGAQVLAAVDALRGEWFTRLYGADAPRQPLEDPRLRRPPDLVGLGPCTVVGQGVEYLAAAAGAVPTLATFDPGPLAPLALEMALQQPPVWEPQRLTAPVYLRAALG